MTQDRIKFELQESEYSFPYHHLPYLDAAGRPRTLRAMGWGLEYLCYMQHIVSVIGELRPKSILDVGCGDGVLLSLLPDVSRRLGVDLSARAIDFARAFGGGEFRVANFAELDERFEVVTAVEVLEHIPDEEERPFLSALGQRVAANGCLVISVPSTVRPVHLKHHRHYTESDLRDVIGNSLPGWNVTSLVSVYRDTWMSTLYRKVFQNRLWYGEVPAVSSLVWRSIWDNRVQSDGSGAHLIATCTPPDQ